MRKLIVFNNVSLDGYFVDRNGSLDWAHPDRSDPEWNAFVSGNAGGNGTLVMGRVTYELMIRYWPTPMAKQHDPAVAEGMNRMSKVVFSRTLKEASWNNTRVVREDLAGEIRRMKEESGEGMAILGSGSIVARLAQERLIDEYHFVVIPGCPPRGSPPDRIGVACEGRRDSQSGCRKHDDDRGAQGRCLAQHRWARCRTGVGRIARAAGRTRAGQGHA
jgi:dihydrofolate reductase